MTLESTKIDFKKSFLVSQCKVILCDNFLDLSPLGIACDRKLLTKVISCYLQEVTRRFKWYSLILAKVIHRCNFIKNSLHLARSPCKFLNFPEFLENFGPDIEYRGFRLCAIIALYTFIFTFLKTQWVRSLENLSKKLFSFAKHSRMKTMACSC